MSARGGFKVRLMWGRGSENFKIVDRQQKAIVCRTVAFLFVFLTPLAAGTWPRYSTVLPLNLKIPAKHPYLVLTPELIAHAKGRSPAQFQHILTEANSSITKPWGQLPPRASTQHRGLASRLFNVGLAYAFSGDKRYAEWVRDGLLAYADLYPTLAFTRGRHKLFEHSLYEATWIVAVAEAYDLVADSGAFTAEQAKHVENDLLRASTATFKVEDFAHDDRLRDLHFRCYNFQAWNIAAAGLVGLATHDLDLVEWSVNSPYGMRHLVGHDIRDDGIFWERSEGYHEFVMHGLLGYTEAMLHCGVDLYNMSVPNDRSKDESENYITDTSDQPKSLRMMFESLFYLTFPNFTMPALGDAGPGPFRANAVFLVGSNRYPDPKLAWFVKRAVPDNDTSEWHWAVYDPPANVPASFPIHEGRFANTGEYRNGCSLFPSTGLAVLRQASGDYTTRPESTAVSLSYGPHGGGHGHSDNMNIVLYAQGRQWIPAFGSMPYETQIKNDWTAQTISHNTMVIDGVSQYPTEKHNVQWPHDDASDRVVGMLDRFDAANKAVSAHCDRAYKGIRLKRELHVDGSVVVDAFSGSDEKGALHQYDYVLHIDGRFARSSSQLEAQPGRLGEICGYQLVDVKQRSSMKGPFDLTFTSDGKELRVWAPASGETEVIVGDGLTNRPDRKMTMLILRRKSADARFLTVFEPVNSKDVLRSVRAEKNTIVIESGQGIRKVPLS
jgi:hypothetical protein